MHDAKEGTHRIENSAAESRHTPVRTRRSLAAAIEGLDRNKTDGSGRSLAVRSIGAAVGPQHPKMAGCWSEKMIVQSCEMLSVRKRVHCGKDGRSPHLCWSNSCNFALALLNSELKVFFPAIRNSVSSRRDS